MASRADCNSSRKSTRPFTFGPNRASKRLTALDSTPRTSSSNVRILSSALAARLSEPNDQLLDASRVLS